MSFSTFARLYSVSCCILRFHVVCCRKSSPSFFKLGHSRPLFLHFRLFNTVDSTYKFCQWLDSNHEPLVLEATSLPTAPQPLPYLHLLSFVPYFYRERHAIRPKECKWLEDSDMCESVSSCNGWWWWRSEWKTEATDIDSSVATFGKHWTWMNLSGSKHLHYQTKTSLR